MNAGFTVMNLDAARFYYSTFLVYCVAYFSASGDNFRVFPGREIPRQNDFTIPGGFIDNLLQLS